MVTLTIDGNLLHVSPWRTCLEEHLVCERVLRDRTKQRGRVKILYESLFSLSRDQTTGSTYAGLLGKIQQVLAERGIPVQIVDRRPPLPDPDWSRINRELRYGQADVMAAIASEYGGIVKAPTAFGKTFTLEQLCRIYPDLRILLVAHSLSALTGMQERILGANPGRSVRVVSGSSSFREGSSICIASAKSLHKIPWDWPQLIFFDEVHAAAAPEVSAELTRFVDARRFGLSASPEGRSDRAEFLLEALFGPVLIDIPYIEAQQHGSVSPMLVIYLQADGPDITRYTYDSARERYGLWHNPLRNRLIAAVARALGDSQVLILVTKVEHALCLKQILSDFELVHSPIAPERAAEFQKMGIFPQGQPLKVDDTQLQRRFREGTLRHVIATAKWSTAVDFPNLRFLIRADGQAGKIPAVQMGGRLSRVAEGKPLGVIFDFYDMFGYEERSHARFAHYKEQGWTVQKGTLQDVGHVAALVEGLPATDRRTGTGSALALGGPGSGTEKGSDFLF